MLGDTDEHIARIGAARRQHQHRIATTARRVKPPRPGQRTGFLGPEASIVGAASIITKSTLYRGRRVVEGALDRAACSDALVEPPGQLRCHGVVDGLLSDDHCWHPGTEQPQRVVVGCAAVEENQLERLLPTQHRRQTRAIRRRGRALVGLEDQRRVTGMTGKMKHRDPVAPAVSE